MIYAKTALWPDDCGAQGGGETVHRLSLYSWNSLRQVNKTSHLYPARIQSKQPLLFWCLVILKNMNLNVFPKWPLLTGQVLGKKQLEVKLYSYSSIRALNLDYFNAAGWRARGPASARCCALLFCIYLQLCESDEPAAARVRTRTSWLTPSS